MESFIFLKVSLVAPCYIAVQPLVLRLLVNTDLGEQLETLFLEKLVFYSLMMSRLLWTPNGACWTNNTLYKISWILLQTFGPSINIATVLCWEFQLKNKKCKQHVLKILSTSTYCRLDLMWSFLISFALLQQICRLIHFLKPFMLLDWAWHMQIQLTHIPAHGKH